MIESRAEQSRAEQSRAEHILLFRERIGIGGVTSVMRNTLETLSRLKVYTTISTPIVEEGAFPLEHIDKDFCTFLILPHEPAQATDALVDYIKQERVSLVIFMGGWSVYAMAAHVKERTSAKIANWYHTMPFYSEQIDKTQAHQSLLDFLKYYLIKLPLVHRLGIKNALYIHHRALIELYDYFILLCPEYKEEVVRRLRLTDDKAAKVISLINTIDTNQTPILEKKKEIAFLGRFHEEKQVLDLLKAWRLIHDQLPDWSLTLYGAGAQECLLKDFVSKHQLPRLEFAPYTNDVQTIYNRTAIVCLTSMLEGWPMALIEAQNNGVVPVSYRCSEGVVSIIGEDQRAGRLVPYGDVAAFGRILVELTTNPTLLKKLQAGCLEKRWDYAPTVNDDTWRMLLKR